MTQNITVVAYIAKLVCTGIIMHSDAYAAHSGGGKMPSGSGYSAIHTRSRHSCSSKGAPGSAGDWVMITGPYPPSADVLPYPALHNHNCVSSASLADALCVSY